MLKDTDCYEYYISLQINDQIAKLVSKVDDEIIDIWQLNKKDIIDVVNFRENLIKYLEDKIKLLKSLQQEALNNGFNESIGEFGLQIASYQDILERVKSGKYE